MNGYPQIFSVEPARRELFSWIQHGSLYRVEFGGDVPGGYLYRDTRGRMAIVSGNLIECSKMISAEIDDKVQAELFLRTRLADVMLSFMGQGHAYIITKIYLENREAMPAESFRNVNDSAAVQRSLAILKHYESGTVATVSRGRWKLGFFVQMQNGSVESWILEGTELPCSVDRLEISPCEREGAVIPMPEVG